MYNLKTELVFEFGRSIIMDEKLLWTWLIFEIRV